MPGIQWRSKETAFRPFKGLLAHPVIPDLGAAAALKNVEQLIVHVSFRLERAARRNLDDVHARDAATTLQLDVRTGSPHARPRLARQLGDILDRKSVKNWNTFLLHPPQIGGFLRRIYNFVHPDSSVLAMEIFNSLIVFSGLDCQAAIMKSFAWVKVQLI